MDQDKKTGVSNEDMPMEKKEGAVRSRDDQSPAASSSELPDKNVGADQK